MGTFANDLRYGARMLATLREGSLARRILASAALSLVFGVGARSPVVHHVENLLAPVPPPGAMNHLIPGPPEGAWYPCLRQPKPYPVALRQGDVASILNSGPHEMAFALTGGGAPELVVAASVAPSDLERLRVHPLLGRTLRCSDNSRKAAPVVMIGEVLWRRRFAADTTIVGKSILLSAHAYRVVGILPANFRFPYASDPVEIWLPAAQDPRRRGSEPLETWAPVALDQVARKRKELATAAASSARRTPRPSVTPSALVASAPAPVSRNIAPVAPLMPVARLAPLAPTRVPVTSQD